MTDLVRTFWWVESEALVEVIARADIAFVIVASLGIALRRRGIALDDLGPARGSA